MLPAKLIASSPTVPPHKRELFILEGDSAMGTIRKVTRKHQELLPIRGKITNAFKATPAKLLKNPDITNIIMSVGCGVGSHCDPKKARVGYIMLLPDSDDDGFHIAALLLAFFYKYMRPVYDANMIYYVKAPLFAASAGTKYYFGYTREELEATLKKKKVKSYNIIRMKGWGGASKEAMEQFACDPQTRTLYKPVIKNHETMEIALERIMGDDTTLRKKLLGV